MEKKRYKTPHTLSTPVNMEADLLRVSGSGNVYVDPSQIGTGNANTMGATKLNINDVWGDEN